MNPAGHVAFAAYEANDSISSRDSRDERVLVASSMQTYPHQRRYAAQVQRPGLRAPTERERDCVGHASTHDWSRIHFPGAGAVSLVRRAGARHGVTPCATLWTPLAWGISLEASNVRRHSRA